MKKFVILLFKFLFIFAAFFYLGSLLDFSLISEHIHNALFFPIFAAILLFLLGRIVMSIKWEFLLKYNGIDLGFAQTLKITFISNFLGLVIPSSIGVDAVRLLHIHKKQKKMKESVNSILADRMLGILSMCIISSFFLCFLWVDIQTKEIVTALLICIFLICLIFTIMSHSMYKLINHLMHITANMLHSWKWLKHHFPGIPEGYVFVHKKISDSHWSFVNLLKNPKLFCYILSINLFFQLIRVAQIHCLFWSLHVSAPIVYELAFVPLIILIAMIPITYYGVGVKESAFVYFFSMTTIAPEIVLSVSIISYILFIPGILIGAFLFLLDKSKFKSGEAKK